MGIKKILIPALVLFVFFVPGKPLGERDVYAAARDKKVGTATQSTQWEENKKILQDRYQSLASLIEQARRNVKALTDRALTLRKQWNAQQTVIRRAKSAARKARLALKRADQKEKRASGSPSAHKSATPVPTPLLLLAQELYRSREQLANEYALGSQIETQVNHARQQERAERKKLNALRREEQTTLSKLNQAGRTLMLLARRLAAMDTPVDAPRMHASAPREEVKLAPASKQHATGTSVEAPVSPVTFQDLSRQQRQVDDFIARSSAALAQEKFSWPIVPDDGISAYFHDASYIEKMGQDHFAIDIVADQGTEIVAPADGLALVAEDSGTGFQYIILLHKNGYLTMFGHVSKFNIEAGDLARQGSVIGWSGGEVGAHGSGRKTTGPHLHFEVWKNNQRLDPLLFLDLSVLPNDPSKVDLDHVPTREEQRSLNR